MSREHRALLVAPHGAKIGTTTVSQAQQFFDVEVAVCRIVFDVLGVEGFLFVKPNGAYGRASEGRAPRARGVTANPS
jgi:hypothetical protein